MAEATQTIKEIRKMSAKKTIAALAAALLAAALLAAVPAQASVGIESLQISSSTTQAGGHPDLETAFVLEDPGMPDSARDASVHLPQGLFGNPNAAQKCTAEDFALTQCPIDSQVGVITVKANYGGFERTLLGTAPVFDMESQSPDETARFAFIAPLANVPINIPISVRTNADYGLNMTVSGISQVIPLYSADITIWGFPASEKHDNERFSKGAPGAPAGCPGAATGFCASQNGSNPHQSTHRLQPLVDNPTTCTGENLPFELVVTSYRDRTSPSVAKDSYPPTTGCENEAFNPVFNAGLTSDRADSAAGLEMQLKAAQFLGVANSPSTLRSATLTLPTGISINPDAADGQTACSDDAANFDSLGPDECPDNSKIGNFDIETPALDGPLEGSLYFGEPKPGNQYRVFMVASGFGIHSKIVAKAFPDADTGQLTMSVTDLPQVPFEQFNLHLFASDRGLVATPTHCGIYQGDSQMIPWNAALAPQQSQPVLDVSEGPNLSECPGEVRPFHPRLEAGSSNAVGGEYTEFHLKLDRDDGDQFLGDLNFRMPPGFTGNLRGVSYCSEAAIAAAAQNLGREELAHPSCPASSQIGTTNVAAGPGSHPFHAVGRMYLAGPFKGAPLSLAAITPALAGPYDYGTQVVRVALHIDPLTAQVSAISDTVPSIIGGVPIRMRSIQVNIDRRDAGGNPNFTINPTNCSPFSVESQGIGDQGTVTDFSSYFHVVNCATLPFNPSMSVRETGKATSRGDNPRLKLDLRTRPGDANVRSIVVTLPNAFEIDQEHLGNICSEKELAATQCAGKQQLGMATTTTPLLDQPLSGPVYAVSGSGGLPKLAFILDGQVRLVPRAEEKTIKGARLQTTVPVVPDAPIGHFSMTVFGGKHGYLANTRSLCRHTASVGIEYIGQNGRVDTETAAVRTPCRGASARHKRHHR
jgi:hypothetical protein